jgi:hypothetical protein
MLARLMIAGTVTVLPKLAKTTAHSPARLMIADAMQIPLAVEMISKNNKNFKPNFFIKPKKRIPGLDVMDCTIKNGCHSLR